MNKTLIILSLLASTAAIAEDKYATQQAPVQSLVVEQLRSENTCEDNISRYAAKVAQSLSKDTKSKLDIEKQEYYKERLNYWKDYCAGNAPVPIDKQF